MTAEISGDPWSTLDDLLGVDAVEPVEEGIGPVAFYGRCSTEDNQDPETSLGWQLGNASKFVEPLGGTIAAEYFDIGQSRSVPWERRHEARRLLTALKDPNRGWNAVVVGEGTRCWFGNQFSLIAPKFAAYGVELWVPELGGKFDARNPSHKMLMNVLGGMSESERQHVQARVRAAMDAQVLNEGRHQGGRAPYGYKVVDAGPHPNPSRAADGYRLKVLAIDDEVVDVVRRIFSEYLGGRGDRAIANGLNRDGIPCPSARRPEQNRHRLADGWQGSTVRAILDNPRYTGYAFFGRWTRQETLLDPDDVAAGHVIRFRRAGAESVVRSRKPAHPEIVSVETFVEAQLRRRSRAAGGLAARRKLERGPKSSTKRAYPLRGRVRCAYCSRRMEGSPRGPRTYYRCSARTLVPGSAVLERHPKNVYLPEAPVVELLNAWLGGLFDRANRDRTVAGLLESQRKGSSLNEREVVEQRLNDAERKLRRLQDAIKAGVDPVALVESVNEAQAEREAAQAELANAPKPDALTDADLHAVLDSLGDVGRALNRADPYKLQELYEKIGLEMTYDPDSRSVETAVNLGRSVSARVRGGT
ncbi:recombinase family protein [Saccharopolyspora flava]|uniref:recombinase family protein n=1 Tax=Saccharopolyspora flava TaxID=95161 RepID=UPI000B850863|nr:recombinase family protein [Saccharopolyspora flava]